MDIKLGFNRKDRVGGIYYIKNLSNGKMYIGSSVNLIVRLEIHRSSLRGNYHDNPHLQNSWNKHGEDAFECGVMEITDNLQGREQHYIDLVQPKYNIELDVVRHTLPQSSLDKLSETRKAMFANGELTPNNTSPVVMYDLNGKELERFYGVSEASRFTNISRHSITRCASGKTAQAKGFVFRYENSDLPVVPYLTGKKGIPIEVVDLKSNETKKFRSYAHVTEELGIEDSSIRRCVRNGKPFKGRFKMALIKSCEFRERPDMDNPEPSL